MLFCAVRGDSVLRLQGEMLPVALPDVSRGNFWYFLFTIECIDPAVGTSTKTARLLCQ